MTLSSSLSRLLWKVSKGKRSPHSLHVIIYAVAYRAKQCSRQMSVSKWNLCRFERKKRANTIQVLNAYATMCTLISSLLHSTVFAVVVLYSQMRRESNVHANTKMKSTKINEFYIRKLCFGFPLDVNKKKKKSNLLQMHSVRVFGCCCWKKKIRSRVRLVLNWFQWFEEERKKVMLWMHSLGW